MKLFPQSIGCKPADLSPHDLLNQYQFPSGSIVNKSGRRTGGKTQICTFTGIKKQQFGPFLIDEVANWPVPTFYESEKAMFFITSACLNGSALFFL